MDSLPIEPNAEAVISLGDDVRLEVVPRLQKKGRGATPWLEPYRKRFASAVATCKVETEKEKGPERVQALNGCISRLLRQPSEENGSGSETSLA